MKKVILLFIVLNLTLLANPVKGLLVAGNSIKSVTKYIGLIESVESKVDKLISVELETAKDLFSQALNSNNEKDILIRNAREHFTSAVYLEEHLRKAMALLGLSSCHQYFGDERNRINALKKVLKIEPISNTYVFSKLGFIRSLHILNSTNLIVEYEKIRLDALYDSYDFLFKESKELHNIQKEIFVYLENRGVENLELNPSLIAYLKNEALKKEPKEEESFFKSLW